MGGGWRTTTLHGHEMDLFEPSQPHAKGLVAIYLHGVHLARLAGQTPFEAAFERHGLRVAVPMTGPCFWTDRRCPAFDGSWTPEGFIRGPVLDWIRGNWGAAPPSIGLFGTSMGGQGALRFAFKTPQTFPVVAALAPAIDYQKSWHDYPAIAQMYDDPEQVRQDSATLHVHPLRWVPHLWFGCDPLDERWWDSSHRLHSKLSSLGVPHSCDLETTGGGHGWGYYNRQADTAVDFLVQGLTRQALALPLA